MICKIHDYPTRYLVDSETVSGDSYLVDLTAFPMGSGFNGSCTCPHFVCSLGPKLRHPNNQFMHRCKHIRFARENCLDFMLDHLKKADPNTHEDFQP